ncbi:MAG TPA: hypothetical protein VF677_05855 [Flavobacterium sp.]|jgi:hypothetical protein
MNQTKILKRLDQLEILGGLMLQEATMLKQELLGVVPGNSTRKGLSAVEVMKIKAKAEKRRQGK